MITPTVRPPAVAGAFYPADREVLGRQVRKLLAQASPVAPPPVAVIAPHAGYVYSGPVAASAFAPLAALAGRIRRVVLLGPAHFVPFAGLALPGSSALATPLGEVPVDREACASLMELPQVTVFPAAHVPEHSLEVELPFLQTVLGDFALVPLLVGEASPEEVADVLAAVWQGDDTLVVVSSDLSHYLEYAEARRLDQATAQQIVDLRWPVASRQACGARPVSGLLREAARRGIEARVLDLRSSGDTAGGRAQVVGYGAFGFYEAA